MLKRSGEKEHPCLVLQLREKASGFSSLSLILTIGLYEIFFIKLKKSLFLVDEFLL